MYLFTRISQNKKIGPIPSVVSSKDTCPTTCALKGNGCYAETGPLALHWGRVEREGLDLSQLLKAIRALPRGQVFRYGTAGDLPTKSEDVLALAEASQGRRVLAYTHTRDFEILRQCTVRGFHANLSADSLEEADELAKTSLPVVVVLSSFYQRGSKESLRQYRDRLGGGLSFTTPGGNHVAICPATYLDTNCASCQACVKPRARNTIIGFPAHGTRKELINQRVSVSRGLSPWINALIKSSSSMPSQASVRI